ncbi:hypothetical protein [Staphylococcus massiliensis]|uniref:Lytic regulatory protein n=2 Tax=Staphylococcus massiliensis TaxID=555791 RepID=K9AW24_9STAP|nr:hypothetical protein [Staphylococcus massiliensis]EKU45705.1 lytic regulatory protein [Staphylococcus massiliensis S46]MCG3400214.1 hypothetical protein [Staphylococcus massiliensis]MCG3413227.1 hypothetical protein [Staphylococcus massiliensis]PNZ96900.1 hypothetical protein CD133_11355 [Staphylococcus massiliensis CCUG 55927]
MFSFHKAFLRNAKSAIPTLILSIIIFSLLIGLLKMLYQLAYRGVVMPLILFPLMMGQLDPVKMVLGIIGIIIAILILYTLVIVPLVSGLTYIFKKIANGEKPHIKDLFHAYKKRHFGKIIKLALATILPLLIGYILLYLFQQLLTLIATKALVPLIKGISNDVVSYIVQTIINLAFMFISSILLALIAIFFINTLLSFWNNPKGKIMQHFKEAIKRIKNGKKTFMKFLIGVLLISLLNSILQGPIFELLQLATTNISQNVAKILITIYGILVGLITTLLNYLNLGAITQYFERFGEKIKS